MDHQATQAPPTASHRLEGIRSGSRMGFLTESDVADFARHEATRLVSVVVRCGGCRFTCAMQDVRHLIALVESGHDDDYTEYVRDVALLAVSR